MQDYYVNSDPELWGLGSEFKDEMKKCLTMTDLSFTAQMIEFRIHIAGKRIDVYQNPRR